MKSEKGVTIISLVIYVAIMTLVIGVMGSILTNFYENTNEVQGNVQEIVEFSKFNNYFLKEIKSNNNKVDHVSGDGTYILFVSGNSFSISNNAVYYNNIKICDGAESLKFTLGKSEEDKLEEYSIINVKLGFKNFKKSITYKVENIY